MYRYEVQQMRQTTKARGQGAERRGGRNCGTFHGFVWKQLAVTNDAQAAMALIAGFGNDYRVFDHANDCVLQARA